MVSLAAAAYQRRLSNVLASVLAILSLVALTSARAHGATPVTGVCPGTVSYPFAPWGDTDGYFLVPGGDFETASGWSLTGGAATVSGNETFRVHAATDTRSLSLPAGSTATTPPICINLYDPTIRFFATGGNSTSQLNVTAIATLTNGTTVSQPLGSVTPTGGWAPTRALYFFANALSLASTNGTATVRFRFSTAGTLGWKVDDVYIDPRKGS
jgi:hypothetical protein